MTKCLFWILVGICLFTSRKFDLDLGDGITKLRKYDIEMVNSSKLEFKDWSTWANWSNSSFRKQFIPDLADVNFTELGQKKYIFKANKNIDATTLKTNVIKALKKADGAPIEEIQKLFGRETDFTKKVKQWMQVRKVTSNSFLDWLDNPENFNKLFEIVE